MSTGTAVDLTLPPGKYYIGDPCYVIADEKWSQVCDQMFPGIPGDDDYENHDIQLDGVHFFAYSTAHGDGVYFDTMYKYGVDSGCIGAVPISLVENEAEAQACGRIIETDTSLECHRDEHGTFYFSGSSCDIEIITDGSDQQEEEYYQDDGKYL